MRTDGPNQTDSFHDRYILMDMRNRIRTAMAFRPRGEGQNGGGASRGSTAVLGRGAKQRQPHVADNNELHWANATATKGRAKIMRLKRAGIIGENTLMRTVVAFRSLRCCSRPFPRLRSIPR